MAESLAFPGEGAAAPDTPFSSRFTLRGRLGSGGMGVVYRAFDHVLGREVALKTLRATDPTLLYHLKQEFRVAAGLEHPNLVQLHELFVADSSCFFSMELIEGVPFHEFVRHGWATASALPQAAAEQTESERDVVSHSQIMKLRERRGDQPPAVGDLDAAARFGSSAAQLADAVAALHDAGLLHCDIKPSNILVTQAGRLVLLDFGLAAPRRGQPARDEFAGTLTYAAPEQLWGEPLTPATDWYAVGGVLCKALTGRPPADDCRQELARHVDLPGALAPEWLRLSAALLEPTPSARPRREVIQAAFGHGRAGGRETGFFGRGAEQRTLALALRAVQSGWLTAVTVHGESGIGKTELVRRFLRSAEREGALVTRAQCRLQESVSHQALDQIVDDLSAHLLSLPRAERAHFLTEEFASLVRSFPVLARVARRAARTGALPDAALERERAVLALRRLLWRVAAERSLVLWIDDAHWGDAESQRLLLELLLEPAPPLLLILSHRDGPAPWVAELAGAVEQAQGQWLDLPLGALGFEPSQRLAARLLGLDAGAPVVAQLASEGAGHPLFLGQLCRLVVEAEPELAADTVAHRTLRDVLERRLAQLSEPERRLVSLAALIEAPLPLAALLSAAGSGSGGAALASQLSKAQLLRLSGVRSEPEVSSFHQRVRDLVRSALAADEQRAGHCALVAALDRLGCTPEPETLLHHLLGAGENERALELAQRAAGAAARRLAFAHAASLYRTALELSEPGPAFDALQSRLAGALAAAGRAGDAGEQYLSLAERTTGAEAVRWLQLGAENLLVGGLLQRGVSVLRRALAAAELRPPRSGLVGILEVLGWLLLFALRSRLRRSAPSGEAAQRDAMRAELCLSAAKGLGAVDPLWSAQFAVLALVLAERSGDRDAMTSALCLSGMLLAAAPGRIGAWGRAWLDRAEAAAAASHRPALEARARVCRAQVEIMHGKWLAALQGCERAERCLELERSATSWEHNMARVAGIRALEELGELKRAWGSAAEWLGAARSRGDLYAETTARLYLAMAALARDRPDEVERLASLTLQQWSEEPPPFQEFYRLRVLAYAALYRGCADAALELAERAHQVLRRAGLQRVPLAVLEIGLLRLRSRLALGRERRAEARSHATACERELLRLERLRQPDAAAHAALLRGSLEALRGRTERARELLALARSGFEQQQMALARSYAQAAEQALDGLDADDERALQLDAELRGQGILKPRAWLALHGVFYGS